MVHWGNGFERPSPTLAGSGLLVLGEPSVGRKWARPGTTVWVRSGLERIQPVQEGVGKAALGRRRGRPGPPLSKAAQLGVMAPGQGTPDGAPCPHPASGCSMSPLLQTASSCLFEVSEELMKLLCN